MPARIRLVLSLVGLHLKWGEAQSLPDPALLDVPKKKKICSFLNHRTPSPTERPNSYEVERASGV